MEEIKCPSNYPEPSCPNTMNPRKLESGVTCCFKGKLKKSDNTKRKRIQKQCTTRNPSVSCPINHTLKKISIKKKSKECCVPNATKKGKTKKVQKQYDILLDFIKKQNINEIQKIIVKCAKKCVHISDKESKDPFINSIELCPNKIKESCNSQCSMSENKCSLTLTQKEFNTFTELVSREIMYNYRRKDDILKGSIPDFIVNELKFDELKNTFYHKDDDDFYKWVNINVNIGNYDKYMNYSFENYDTDDSKKIKKNYHINTKGLVLPYAWHSILHLDYRYNNTKPMDWVKSIEPSKRKEIKEIVGDMKKNIDDALMKKVSLILESTILILYLTDTKTQPSNLKIYNYENDEKNKTYYIFFFYDRYYPVFLYENIYTFKNLSVEMMNMINNS